MKDPVDAHVGQRLRQLRHARGLSQSELGKLIGVQFQQVQKYETGYNRVAASRIYHLAKSLNVSPNYFFEGLDLPEPNAELRSQQELFLLCAFRAAPEGTQHAILRIAQEAAKASNPNLKILAA